MSENITNGIARADEYTAVVREADLCFTGNADSGYFKMFYPKLYKEEFFSPESHYVVRDRDKIVALIGSFGGTIRFFDKELKYNGIGTVCVDTNYRSRGFMTTLMNASADDMIKNGTDFAFLGGRRQRYEHYGYTPAGICSDLSFNSDNLRHLYGKNTDFGFTFNTLEESDEALLDAIFGLYNKRVFCAKREREKLYDFLTETYKHTVVIFKENQFFGYANVDGDETNVFEFELTDISELGHVLADWLVKKEKSNINFCCVYPFEKEKIDFFSEKGEWGSVHSIGQFRVYNFINVLNALFPLKKVYGGLCDGTLTVDVAGVQKLKIEVSGGNANVTEFDGEADITLSPLDATSAFFGVWNLMGHKRAKLPACAESWFPLPLTMTRPDFV